MIPLRLQLKNFLSYGSEIQTIDLSSYPLICLSGKNGHGKSALLDAITWALWGQARKVSATSRADFGLVRLGQTQMMVTLDFECNGQRYRVKREYMITYGKPLATLEFGIYQSNTIIPLTDKTLRKTQEKIVDTLHLNFESFINSAFLRQGQSNEFSKKSPKERKEILASILGLDQYDGVRRLALEKAKEASTKQQVMYTLQEKYYAELEHKKELEIAQTTITQKLEQLQKEEEQLEKQQSLIETKQYSLTREHEKYTGLILILEQYNNQRKELEKKLSEVYKTWRAVHKKQLKASSYTTLNHQKQQLLKQHELSQKKLDIYLHIKEACIHQKDLVQRIKQSIEQQHQVHITKETIKKERLNNESNNLKQQLHEFNEQKQNIEKEYQNYQTAILDLQKSTQADEISLLDQMIEQFDRTKEVYHALNARYANTTIELNTLHQKKQFISDISNPSCPLCEQNLSASRKRFLQTKFETNKHTTTQKLAELKEQLIELTHKLTADQSVLKQQKKLVEEQKTQRLQLEQLTKQQAQHRVTLMQLDKKRQAVQQMLTNFNEQENTNKEQVDISLEQLVKDNINYKQETEKLVHLNDRMKKHNYNAKEHQHIKKQLEALEQELIDYEYIKQENQLQEQRKNTVTMLCNNLRILKKETSKVKENISLYTHLPLSKNKLEQEKSTVIEQYKKLQVLKNTLSEEKGKLDNKHEALEYFEQEYKKQKEQIAELEKTKHDYQTIAIASGKDGIQALLIEQIIPEIELEANNLLAELSDNQTHIMLESLRDLKKGGTKETLDIKISDTYGVRPYELFSGGEAFRIDFALRIAISKLLARRSGTTLQTLIIDEGFGSQDEEGLAHIMDAIYKIQDDFSKIIIVSHLSTMKNQFPVHFIINKKPEGSHIQIVEQG